MKKTISLAVAAVMCFSMSGCSLSAGAGSAILIVLGLVLMLFSGLRTFNMLQYNKRKRRRKTIPRDHIIATGLLFMIAFLLVFIGILMNFPTDTAPAVENTPTEQTQQQGASQETTEPVSLFVPSSTTDSAPSNWGIDWEIFENGAKVGGYKRMEPISFGEPEDYFALPGIATFRGNNYRNAPTYGTANVENEVLVPTWSSQTSTLPGSSWSGSGWTGQPLIVKWDQGTKAIMNMYDEAKAKTDLVEVIYATLDGNIYFLDLENGAYTRDPINVGMCFKGAGALDPRGYPLMYVGSGDENSAEKRPRMYIISLIDGSILYEYGYDEDLSIRTDNNNWCAFDSSPLVHAETDTLIWPGESGILYTMKLNTSYDKAGGTLSINPDNMVVTRYDTARSGSGSYWYGYEASAVIVKNYLYISENGGMFFCIDLNTMGLVWAQDTVDDSNCSPVFEWVSDTEAYIYTAPSLHWTRSENMDGTISLYKLNALTGQIVWESSYYVHTIDGVSGGVQSTPLLGKPGTALEGLVIFSIARTPDTYTGQLVALDTKTGEEVWSYNMDLYPWSSPVAVYEDDGNAYVIICDSGGYMRLLNAEGKLLYTVGLGGNIEATPAVYEDMIVVGTRTQTINGIKIQ